MGLSSYTLLMANFTDPERFARRLNQIGAKIEENSGRIVRGAALVVDQVLVVETPVLSGRARSGWNVGIGSEPTFVPEDEPASPEAGQASALAQGQQAIGQWKVGDAAIYISNGLPYIRRLNDGYSAQAPTGMVDQAVQAGEEYVGQQRLLRGI